MRRLYVCNTPYQILISLLLAFQLKGSEEDISDILITDNFLQSKEITDRVSRVTYFEKVYYAKISNILYPRSFMKKISKFYDLFLVKHRLLNYINPLLEGIYDEIFYNNDNLFLYSLTAFVVNKNTNLKVYRYEEGYSTYMEPWCSLRGKKLCIIREKVMLKKTFDDVFCGLYVFEPTLLLYKLDKPILKISRIINDDIKHIISEIFEMKIAYNNLKEKWIIFEESFYQDHKINFDIMLYEKIFKILGKENVVVKMHPRSEKDRFSELGIHTIKSDGVPWEAILLSNKMHKKKYIALASGSIINARLLLGETEESYLMYKCLENPIPNLDSKFEAFIKKYASGEQKEGLTIPDSLETFRRLIQVQDK